VHLRRQRWLLVSNARDQDQTTADLRGLARVGILVISDRASRGEYSDESGRAINDFLTRTVQSNWIAVIKIVPDGVDSVANALVEMSDREECDLVLTTGGTGPSPRDLTPEGTRMVITRELEGFGELMRCVSLEQVPTAILSRQTAGTRGRCLIVNLPGRPSAIDVCLNAVFPAIPYCLDLIGARPIEVNPDVCHAFRPGR
jgi:molybdopterin adenylyltransferase